MVDSLGVLQRDAPPSITDYQLRNGLPMVSDTTKAVWTPEQLREQSEEAGKNLVAACLEFEKMLDELPTLIRSEEDQTNRLKDFQSQNENQTHLLKQKIDLAEDYLQIVSNSIEDITNNRLQVRHQSKKK
ncbi:predicted protein [Naegleria gruberi]|uniref:Mediator of RNA polymerase II transcription subunit 21 n=1 Tax=Naegleria gruberi TaxID=5762 RepID=D2VQF4_NAEGR|nr:uncharacterized protein NAEGRDRAFT_71206 [Naegleria gruberi]EFC40864.1 predicted protein [Naegleria gruberi]|eukprot:XP_002673608.1 predicted protein [Naegleria gruberi strain NEG-M]